MNTTHYPRLVSPDACERIKSVSLYYDRRDRNSPIPDPLKEYVNGSHTLYMRQVPCSTTLKRASGRLIPTDVARKIGVRLPKEELEIESDESFLDSSNHEFDGWNDDKEDEDLPWEAPTCHQSNKYENPWKIMAGYCYSSQYCDEKPEINVWSGGHKRITDPVVHRLFGLERPGRTRFLQVSSVEQKLFFLRVHTHWGYALGECRIGRSDIVSKPFAKFLWRRICRFLRGFPDPLWSKEETLRFWKNPNPRKSSARAIRLIEVLKTIDGLFLQRYLCFPEEVWDWKKYDAFVIQSLSLLISDEFFDGELNSATKDQPLFYEVLKRARKQAKLAFHTNLDSEYEKLESFPRWIQVFLGNTWKFARKFKGSQFVELAGILSQTRGCGTPPALLLHKSKIKFLSGIQKEPVLLSKGKKNLIIRAMNLLEKEIPEHIFSGLGTKARVTVTGSACAEKTRVEGGTAEAILNIIDESRETSIPIRDLDTGRVIQWKTIEKFENIGTAIFWACLHRVMNTNPVELRKVHLTMIKEPGKGRVVTKGVAALKIVLDTISKICCYPLKKAVDSSHSGMGKSNHGWNFFLELFKEDRKHTTFKIKEVESETFADHIKQMIIYEDLYFSSTDYQEATDALQHEIAQLISEKWMKLCGIPPLLRGIVHGVCFQERTISFKGTGLLSEIGTPSGELREVTLRTGILMGDPLTKPILHLVNILVRKIPQGIESAKLLLGINQAEALSISEGILGVP